MEIQYTTKRVRPIFCLLLLFSLAFATQWTIRAHYWQALPFEPEEEDLEEFVLASIPHQLRRIAADYLWLRADEYMHFGPSRRYRGAFLAGSYAGNTEILPLLELTIKLDPTHFEAYGILAQNLALYLDRFWPAIRLLQNGILHNKNHPFVHELYGSIAYCLAFVKSYDASKENNRQAALRYLDAALEAFARSGLPASAANDVLNPINYQIMRARFLVECGQPKAALQAWLAAGQPLGREGGLLGEYLRRVAAGLPVPSLPENLLDETYASSTQNLQPVSQNPLVPTNLAASSNSDSHSHSSECDHESGTCAHHSEPIPLLDRNRQWLSTYLQMILLGVAGILMLKPKQWLRSSGAS